MSDSLKLENQLCHRFYTVSNAFSRAYRPLLSELDITYPQYIVMMSLWEQDGVTIARLLEHTRIDGGAMSLILKKLQAKGFIEVKTAEQDKRHRIISLTTKGMAARSTAESVPQHMMCRLNQLNYEEVRQLYRLIDKLSDNLQQVPCAPSPDDTPSAD